MAVIVALGLLGPAALAQYSFPNTISAAGANWYISDNMTGVVVQQGNPGPGGFGFSDAEFANAGGLDAYDGGFLMRINNTLFVAPPATTSFGGNVLSTGASSLGNLTARAEFWFDPTRPLVRSLYSFTNPTGVSNTYTFRWEVNLGSDSATTVRGTSSGDNLVDLSDRWLVSTDNNGGDVVNTLVRYGKFAPHPPDAAPYMPGDPAKDLLADQYTVSIGPGQTARLMMYGWLGSITNGFANGYAQSITDAAIFDDYDLMTQAGLFAGLQNFNEIINWAVVPEPGVPALVATGLLTLVVWRRWLSRR